MRVIDESSEPVDGAQIRCIALAACEADSPGSRISSHDLDALGARLGQDFVSDREGLVCIPDRPAGYCVVGEKDGRTGLVFCGQPDDEPSQDGNETVWLVLREDRALRVHVVDSAGAPAAGIPVALRFRGHEQVVDVFRTVTDAGGQAKIRHLQEVLPGDVTDEGTSVAIALLASTPIESVLRVGGLPRKTIELVAPDTGSLEIRLEGGGQPLDLDAPIELEVARPQARTASEEAERGFTPPARDDRRVRLCARDGRARIEHVGLGLALDVRVTLPSARRLLELHPLGPRTRGEEVIVHVPVLASDAVPSGIESHPAARPAAARAAGQVVDSTGAPICGANVRLDRTLAGYGYLEDQIEAYVRSSTTAADGAFALQGVTHRGRVEFQVSREGYSPRSLAVPLGSSDLVVRLWRGGGLAGRVLVDDASTCDALEVVAVQGGEVRASCSLREDGAFTLEDLEPGVYDVAVRLPIEPEFSLVVPAIAVVAGETRRDARLQALDLREVLRTFLITLVPRHDETFVRRRPPGANAYVDADDWGTEPLLFTTSHPALDLRISANGCRTVELLGVSSDRELELPAALEVALRVSPPVALCKGEWLELELSGRGDELLPSQFGPRFRDGETAVTHLLEPGDYVVELTFLQGTGLDPRKTPLPLDSEVVLHVVERDESQHFDIALPPAALAAIERARADPPPRAK